MFTAFVMVGSGSFLMAIPIYDLINRLLGARTRLLTVAVTTVSVRISIGQVAFIVGGLMWLGGLLYLKYAFKQYKKTQWLDY